MKIWNQSELTSGVDREARNEETTRHNRTVILGVLLVFAVVLALVFGLPVLLD